MLAALVAMGGRSVPTHLVARVTGVVDATQYDVIESGSDYDVRGRVVLRHNLFAGGRTGARANQALARLRQHREAGARATALLGAEPAGRVEATDGLRLHRQAGAALFINTSIAVPRYFAARALRPTDPRHQLVDRDGPIPGSESAKIGCFLGLASSGDHPPAMAATTGGGARSRCSARSASRARS